jgi:hypothetical protein
MFLLELFITLELLKQDQRFNLYFKSFYSNIGFYFFAANSMITQPDRQKY